MPYDLFISYSRKDNAQGRITQLVQRLSQDFQEFARRPLNSFFDVNEIHGMHDWRHRILQGLKESRLLLACLSPSYLESEYCEWEFNEFLKHDLIRAYLADGVAPIYFVEVPGWEDKDFESRCAAWVAELRRRQHFDLRPWFKEGEEALRNVEVKMRLDSLGKRIADQIGRGEREERRLGNLDRHNEHFVGRVSEMRRLHELVGLGKLGVLTAVHGLGGIGKTALALQYAHAYGDAYAGGCWQIRCEGQTDLRAAFASLAGARDLAFEFTEDEKLSLDLQFERVLRELRQRALAADPGKVLIILDNVDRPELLEPAEVSRLPRADWLTMLATTRLGPKQLEDLDEDNFLPVDEMPEEDALALMEAYQRGGSFANEAEREAAREIVHLVGRLPLAVEAATVFLGQYREVSCAAFLARLKKDGLAGLETAAGQATRDIRHGEKRLSVTLASTLERLSDPERLALSYAALLPADQIALPWIRTLVAQEFPEIGQDAEPGWPDPWKNLLYRLLSLRLWQATVVMGADREPLVVKMHRLVQEVVRGELTSPQMNARQESLLELVRHRNAALQNTITWTEKRWELEPLEALANLWAGQNHAEAAWLSNQVGQRWDHLAEWIRAEPLLRQALTIAEQSFGANNSKVAICLNNLAQLLQATNRLQEAEPLMRRALAIDAASFGLDHPKVANRLNNLALLLKATNRLQEAEPLMRRALAIDEASFGPDHPDVATDLNNLASLLKATNRLGEAEPLMRRALAIDEQSSGPEHPNVATRLNNLAQLLKDNNRLGEAEPLARHALQKLLTSSSRQGPHPNLKTMVMNYAGILLDSGSDKTEVMARLNEILGEFGFKFGE